MKRIIKIIFSVAMVLVGLQAIYADSGSGQGYDPTNPPEPNARFQVKATSAPSQAGYIYGANFYAPGDEVSLYAEDREGFVFSCWKDGDVTVSTEREYRFTMPNKSRTLVAFFDYNPTSPEEPINKLPLRIYASPSEGGSFSPDNAFLLAEGESIDVYAYSHDNYIFQGWKHDGKILPNDLDGYPQNPLTITMEDHALEYTAIFAVKSPDEPGTNGFNPATGQMLINDFQPGDLTYKVRELIEKKHIQDGDDFFSSRVNEIVVVGPILSDDFGFINNLRWYNLDIPNCTVIDFCKTSAANPDEFRLPDNSFSDLTALTKVILPANLKSIGYCAFNNCPNLSEIVCYATLPPAADSESFGDIPRNIVLRVPSESMNLYASAEGWKEFNLEAVDDDAYRIILTLPTEASDGRYRNMTLVLENPSSARVQRLVVNDRLEYIFSNLVPDSEYNLYLRNSAGETLASILSIKTDNENEKTFDLHFDEIKEIFDLTLTVEAPGMGDVTGDVEIQWSDEDGNYISTGSSLKSVLEGNVRYCKIVLPQSLGTEYFVPEIIKVVASQGSTDEVLILKKLPSKTLSGRILDGNTGNPLGNAYVSIEQLIADKYLRHARTITDANGTYKLPVVISADTKGKVNCGVDDYLPLTTDVFDFSSIPDSKDFELKPITGAKIYPKLNWYPVSGKGPVVYQDYDNVEFSLYNRTAGKFIQSFVYQNSEIVIIDNVKDGDEIDVTVSSRKDEFEHTTASVKVMNSDIVDVSIDVLEHGAIEATYSPTEDAVVNASLYDENGRLVKSLQFDSKKMVSFSGIKAGNYKLVAIRDSRYYQAVNSYEGLVSSGLKENEDFAMASLMVEDGRVTYVSFDEIPVLPEPDFLSNVTLTVNKTALTVGNYVTVRASVEFNRDYQINNFGLRFDIPEGCSYVKNSLIKDNKPNSNVETVDGSIVINDVSENDVIRFCLMPEKGEEFRPTAFAEFDYNGSHYSQPIGSIRFVGEDFKIFVPKRTCREYVYARGVTTGISDVTLLTNGIPSGNTRSTADGNWVSKVELIDPQQSSIQQIYGEVLDSRGKRFPTISTLVEYDPYYPELEVVKMVHNGTTVNFDHSKAKTSRKSYSYVPSNDMFSLMAKFDENKERVSAVTFHIIATDGTEKTIDGVYVESTQSWVAALGYPDSYRLPVNVTVDFSYTKLVPDPEKPGATVGEFSNFYMGYIAPDVTPIIDPSGFVYEAYEDNRLEGVKVTVFYREGRENLYGEIEWETVKWDAAEYAQENPLFTDANGLYAWDVPAGEWQVKYEKDGYDTAYSAWLPVPPPQLEVNMGMVQNTRPEVSEAHAYAEGVSIQFDKPMQTMTLIPENIRVLVNDVEVKGKIILPQADSSIPSANVRFEYDDPLAVNTDELQLIVSSQVRSYADLTMLEDYTQKLSIEKEITEIKADNTSEITLGEPTSIVVSALPVDAAVGRTLVITNDSPDVIGFDNELYEYILDENGQAEVAITGLIPGMASLTFAVKTSDVTGSKKLEVKNQVINPQQPNSTLADGTGIYDEAVIELSTKTPQAVIYYTLDGTDPTSENGKIYIDPITVTCGDVVKAVTIVGNVASPVSIFNYPAMTSKIEFKLSDGWNWVSHNLAAPLNVEKVAGDNVEQILSLDEELIRDPELGLIGDLKELEPTKSYKIKSNGSSSSEFSDLAINPSKPVILKKGWNWIGYSPTQIMTINEALCDVLADKDDYIIGKDGYAIFDGSSWIGELETLKPGAGYMYQSTSSEKVLTYNKKIVSNAGSLYAPSYKCTSGSWVVDRNKYPSIMPVIANVINPDGNVADIDEYTVLAFCGTECRGIGVAINDYVMISVYGNSGDKINFHLLPSGAENTIMINDFVDFSESLLGSLESPYRIEYSHTSGVDSEASEKDIINYNDGIITVAGDVESIEVFNVDGQKLRSVKNGGNKISLRGMNSGIHLVVVKADGVWSYHKIMLK